MTDHPETPEATALALLQLILDTEEKTGRKRNEPTRHQILDLYAECLAAANGDRNTAANATLH
jgi:hypothetical protein